MARVSKFPKPFSVCGILGIVRYLHEERTPRYASDVIVMGEEVTQCAGFQGIAVPGSLVGKACTSAMMYKRFVGDITPVHEVNESLNIFGEVLGINDCHISWRIRKGLRIVIGIGTVFGILNGTWGYS
jgi:hypothetical protein